MSSSDDRFILFVDFLGFSAATQRFAKSAPDKEFSDEERGLLNLLHDIQKSDSRHSEGYSQSSPESSSAVINITPEFSAFSDHMVASYPLNFTDYVLPAPVRWELLLKEALRIITPIALRALDLGFLIRGGLTVGKLHHDARVVFGAGFVEAYEIERSIAIYPRVALSHNLHTRLSYDDRTNYLIQDPDGIWHLDYFKKMCHQALETNSDKSGANAGKWKSASLEMIDGQIECLERRNKLKEKAKWVWFKNTLNDAIRKQNPAKFED